MIEKSPDAYRTISEVADDLELPQHVLRFWETRFSQIKPLKRGGGRRYYRPDDVELLKSIRHLLYNQGYTIKGVQRILKENGPKAVAALLHTPPSPCNAADHDDDIDLDEVPDRVTATQDVAPAVDESARAAIPRWLEPQVPETKAVAPPAPPVHREPPPVTAPMRPTEPAAEPVPKVSVSFTRGGLRPIVVDDPDRVAAPVVVPKPRPAQPLHDLAEPATIEPPDEPPPAPAGRLSEAQRRSLQAALFELSECRRSLQKLQAQADA